MFADGRFLPRAPGRPRFYARPGNVSIKEGKSINIEVAELRDGNEPLYTMGVAAKHVGTTVQTLRLYEKHGFALPARGCRNRIYSENDIRRLRCVRELIHIKKFSIEAIKKLFTYAACWQIKECPEDMRLNCSGFGDQNRS